MAQDADNVGQKPGYIYELTADIGCGRNLSIRGNFPMDATKETINAQLDLIVTACDRQLSKAIIPGLEAKLRQEDRTLDQFQANVKLIRNQHKGHAKVPPTAEANLENAEANVVRQQAIIDEQKKLLERTKKDAE